MTKEAENPITKEQIKAAQDANLAAAVEKIQAILEQYDVTLAATASISADGRIVATPIIQNK